MSRNSPSPPPRPPPPPSWYMDEHSVGQDDGLPMNETEPPSTSPDYTDHTTDRRPPSSSVSPPYIKRTRSPPPPYPALEFLPAQESRSLNLHRNTLQMDRESSASPQCKDSARSANPVSPQPNASARSADPFPLLVPARSLTQDDAARTHLDRDNEVIELRVVSPLTGLPDKLISLPKIYRSPQKIFPQQHDQAPNQTAYTTENEQFSRNTVTMTTADPAGSEAQPSNDTDNHDNPVYVRCCRRKIACPKQLCDRGSARRCARRLVYIIPVILVLLVFLALMPLSFVFVEHYQMALKRFRSTGEVEKNVTYYPGCYVLGPDAEFLLFTMSGHYVERKNLAVFSASQMEIMISLKLLYFIRPEELGELYTKYGPEYQDVIDRVITAALKNRASSLTLDEIRLQRHLVEQYLHNATRDELKDLHVDVRFMWFEKVDIPANVRAELMNSLIQQVKAETEVFKQQQLLVSKRTTQYSAAIGNSAQEVLQYSRSVGSLIESRAEARSNRIVEATEISGWAGMCQRLGLSEEEHKLSLLLVNSLGRMEELYLAPSDAQANFSYSHFPGYQATLASFR